MISVSSLSRAHAEKFALRRAADTGEVHLVVRGSVSGQHYRVLTPADVIAEADHYCLADLLFTADPDQLTLPCDCNTPTAA
jgi:hypothetical protein